MLCFTPFENSGSKPLNSEIQIEPRIFFSVNLLQENIGQFDGNVGEFKEELILPNMEMWLLRRMLGWIFEL